MVERQLQVGHVVMLVHAWVQLKVEIHEIQFTEVTNYRNPPALDREPRFVNVVANTWL